MGTIGARCGEICNGGPGDQELKVEINQVDRDRDPVIQEQVSPIPSVCQRYAQINNDTSWLTTEDSYKLSKDKGVYYGDISNGLPNGFGRVLNADGSLFQGQFLSGVVFTQKGLYIYPDGSYYLGGIHHNKAKGCGTFVFKKNNQLVYSGQWLDDMPHGSGTEDLADGSHYQGDFKNGIKQGNGLFRWPNGDLYKGYFREGMMQGEGAFNSKITRYRYEGHWHKNKKQGQGMQNLMDQSVIRCEFLQGRRTGKIQLTRFGKVIYGYETDGKFIVS